MTIVRPLLTVFLAILLMAPGSASAAQQHIVPPAQLAATAADHAAAQDADRAAIREALARPEVRSAAGKLGVDMNRIEGAVGTLAGADLERAASTARQVNTQLVGGASTVTISTTTIIIVLLIIILIVVAAN
jgi:hypothetical protein